MTQKRHKLNLVLNEIKKTNDPTIIPCTYIIMDFDRSDNNVIVEKEVALEGGKSLINKPIVAKYNEVEEHNTATDSFGSHEQIKTKDKYGNTTIKSNTIPIGVFTTEAYLTTINVDGIEKEVMAADAVMWYSRYSDAIDLLLEWYSRGIQIHTSCEYLYNNYSFKDGIEYHHSPIWFEGHCVLNSEDRGNVDEVLPAYTSSHLLSFNEINKFNKLVAQANKQKEDNEKMALSHSEIREILQEQINTILVDGERAWVVDVYETYLIANFYKYSEEENYDKYFKVDYTREEDKFSIAADSKVEVKQKRDWVEVTEYEILQNELETVKTQISEKEEKITELETQLNSISTDKTDIETKFTEASEKLVQLNSLVQELEPIKIQFETEKLEKAISEQMDFYFEKFSALNAKDKYETDEVKELIRKTVNESDEGKEAKLQLSSMLVDLVVSPTQTEPTVIREVASKRENLLPADNSFDSRYTI